MTFDVIAKEIKSVIESFELQQKVDYVVTDNGSNFIKAFRVYKKPDAIDMEEDENEFEERVSHNDSSLPSSSDSEESETDSEGYLSISDIVQNSFFSPSSSTNVLHLTYLPEHIRCASHTLNLLAKTDFQKAIESQPHYKSSFDAAMNKISRLWTRISKSTLASDQVQDMLGKSFSI